MVSLNIGFSNSASLSFFLRQIWLEQLPRIIYWILEVNGEQRLQWRLAIGEINDRFLSSYKAFSVEYCFSKITPNAHTLQGVRDAAVELLHTLVAVHAEVHRCMLSLWFMFENFIVLIWVCFNCFLFLFSPRSTFQALYLRFIWNEVTDVSKYVLRRISKPD